MKTTEHTTLPGTTNIFVNSLCNYHCEGCYATFKDIGGQKPLEMPLTEAAEILRQIAGEPLAENMPARKVTFVGGEPTLYRGLPTLVKLAKSLGLVTTVVTNGLTLTPNYLESFAECLDWIGLSIDGLTPELNQRIGRATAGGRTMDAAAYLDRIAAIRQAGVRLKINTVVSSLNWQADFTEFIREANPARWKILQVTPVSGQNDRHIKLLEVGREKFDAFVARHQPLEFDGIRIIAEPVETIRGSYIMIAPNGRFFDSTTGKHRYSERIVDVGLGAAFKQVTFDEDKYIGRDGNYDPLQLENQHELVAN